MCEEEVMPARLDPPHHASEMQDDGCICARCGSKFQRQINFRYHERTCEFKRGSKRKLGEMESEDIAQQTGGGVADQSARVAMGELAAPLAGDPIARTIPMHSRPT